MKVLIINPFSSINYLSESFKHLSIHTTALYTYDLSCLDNYMQPDQSAFDQQIYVDSFDINTILATLNGEKFDYVLNGSDSSVELTDKLAHAIAPLYANDLHTSANRSDKFFMHNALRQNGLKHIKQLECLWRLN